MDIERRWTLTVFKEEGFMLVLSKREKRKKEGKKERKKERPFMIMSRRFIIDFTKRTKYYGYSNIQGLMA